MRFGDQVRAVNLEGHPLEWTYASRRFILPVGVQGTVIPWELAVMHLGNPDAGDVVRSADSNGTTVWLPARADEVRRLKSFYDNHNCPPGMCDHHPGVTGVGDESKVFFAPKVEIWDLITGERVGMLVDDPLGDTVRPASRSVSEEEALRGIIRSQQDQIDALKASVDLIIPTQESDTYLSHAPGTPSNPVDLEGSVSTGDAPPRILLDTETNLVSTKTSPFPDDDLPRDV